MPDTPETAPPAGRLSEQELAMLAHEVRGALTVINGYSELLRRRVSADDHTRALDGIGRAVRRIDSLLQSALHGSVAEKGLAESISLAQLAGSVAEEQRAVSGRDIEVSVDGDPHVAGVPEALERVLDNLIGNALKYSLRSSSVEVGVSTEDDRAVISVADRGPGIPEAERDRVLQPFERLDAHSELPGTGLGLTVVQSVVQAHGGELQIRDRSGGGALVRVSLPLLGPSS